MPKNLGGLSIDIPRHSTPKLIEQKAEGLQRLPSPPILPLNRYYFLQIHRHRILSQFRLQTVTTMVFTGFDADI
jgi:hypothetical protein